METACTSTDCRQPRTSLYLVRRIDALQGVLRFFLTPQKPSELRMQFLAQYDFWEWEMENLIEAFVNFSDRQKTWDNPHATAARLNQMGIPVRASRVQKATWRGKWRTQKTQNRIAPVEMLKEIIDEWNRLIDLLEQDLIAPMQKYVKRYNIQVPRDLTYLRKQMPCMAAAAGE